MNINIKIVNTIIVIALSELGYLKVIILIF